MIETPFQRLKSLEQAVLADSKAFDNTMQSTVMLAEAHQSLAISLVPVDQIVKAETFYQIPGVKPWLLGLHARQSELVTVTDLGHYLFGQSTHPSSTGIILMVSHQDDHFGFYLPRAISFVPVSSLDPMEDSQMSQVQCQGRTYELCDLVEIIQQPAFMQTRVLGELP